MKITKGDVTVNVPCWAVALGAVAAVHLLTAIPLLPVVRIIKK